jgi:mono/diheme cytochrome c family protein
MKLRHIILLAIIAILITACNFTLAQDVTPPPDYVPPTPVPTLGPLYPSSAPDIKNGATIYVEKCAACHGETGLGDGAQGKQLPVKVAAIGLPATAQKAIPSDWYTTVTQGKIDRFMPPFASLNDQERWNVIAYALTLHTTPAQIEEGKSLFEANCADCTKNFINQKMMSALSENDIIQMVKEGAGDIPAFGSKFTDDEAAAVAAYIRTLTFAAPPAAPTVAPATQTSINADSGTPSAETTPQAGVTPEATTVAGVGKVSGSIDNQTGTELPADAKVTLHVFAHSGDMNSGPQEINSLEGTVNADGTFVFENVEMPESRIFVAEVNANGMTYQSDFAVAKAGDTELALPPITLFAASSDLGKLTVNQMHIFLDIKDGTLQVIEFFNVVNSTDTSILIPIVDNQMTIAKLPANMTSIGFDAQQGQAMPVGTADGFALPPSEKMYGIAAGFEMPYDKSAEIEIPFALNIPSGSVLTPIGVKLEGAGLADQGPTDIGSGTMYQVYQFGEIKPDSVLKIKLSGQPEQTSTTSSGATETKSNQPLLIGVGALGVVLILAGIWMYMRDRRKREEEVDEEESDEFEDPESLMDAIIALDDLHRAGKIPDEAYQQRRNELKDALKRRN